MRGGRKAGQVGAGSRHRVFVTIDHFWKNLRKRLCDHHYLARMRSNGERSRKRLGGCDAVRPPVREFDYGIACRLDHIGSAEFRQLFGTGYQKRFSSPQSTGDRWGRRIRRFSGFRSWLPMGIFDSVASRISSLSSSGKASN
jgi:hypothetical protein